MLMLSVTKVQSVRYVKKSSKVTRFHAHNVISKRQGERQFYPIVIYININARIFSVDETEL